MMGRLSGVSDKSHRLSMKRVFTRQSGYTFFSRERTHLMLLNLITCLSLFIFLLGMFGTLLISVGFTQPDTLTLNLSNMYCSIMILSFTSFVVFCVCLMSRAAFQKIKIPRLLRAWWFFNYLAPFLAFFSLSSFDFENTIGLWSEKFWPSSSYLWVRQLFCESDTAETLCKVPTNIYAGGGSDVDAWCLSNYNSTSCYSINVSGLNNMKIFSLVLSITLLTFGLFLLVCFVLIIMSLRQLIGTEFITAINLAHAETLGWLIIPVIPSLTAGLLLYLNVSVWLLESQLVYVFFFIYAGFTFLSSVMGLLITHKSANTSTQIRWKLITIKIFMSSSVLSAASAVNILVFGVVFWLDVSSTAISESTKVDIACSFDYSSSCTGCPQTCDEWTKDQVLQVLRSSFKVVAALAVILFLYSLANLRTGMSWLRFYKSYRVEYV
ncbi:hypothetical protein TrVE_jg10801 [Triparma verrucosa]|uniref:Uncharacterized protein n=1 Tax=Triparma verrucosa TaxID=1606542 RepID=A0A9W7BPI6_9STRA|nr:hypothetical protein TrVE_jg10801 [Triparma verrucosa]